MKKILVWTGLIIVVIAAAYFASVQIQRDDVASPEFRTGLVNRGTLQAMVASTGTINPVNTVIVGSQLSGKIEEIYVDFNAVVLKDQVVARIDSAVYEAQL
jgi:HlyD family secretion protein